MRTPAHALCLSQQGIRNPHGSLSATLRTPSCLVFRCAQIEMLLNNVRNGDALWHAAEEYGKKIRRMDLAGNVEAAATRAEFLAQWPEIEDRKYEIDVDGGIEMAANLAGVSGQNMEEMFIP